MKKIIALLFLALGLVSCIQDSPTYNSSTAIESFSFDYHSNAPQIEAYTFTVDTVTNLIYNRDSVLYNMDITKLRPTIYFLGNPSKLYMNEVEWNKKDSLDFSKDVSLKVVSQNGQEEEVYTIQVRKHKVNPNEIHWAQQKGLHLEFDITSTRSLNYNDKFYVFLELENGEQRVYHTLDFNNWVLEYNSRDPFLQISSIRKGSNSIFGVDKAGKRVWSYNSTTPKWDPVVPVEEGQLLEAIGEFGNIQKNFVFTHKSTAGEFKLQALDLDTYELSPVMSMSALPVTFPEKGAAVVSIGRSINLLGGTKEGQLLTCLVASEDGVYWTDLLHQPEEFSYPARTGAAASFYEDVLLLIGGKNEKGEITKDIYYSENDGFSWLKATPDMVLPEAFIPVEGADAVKMGKYVYLMGGTPAPLSPDFQIWRGQLRKTDFEIK